MFRTGQHVGSPIESVVDVVDRAAGLGWFVHGAEVLPF